LENMPLKKKVIVTSRARPKVCEVKDIRLHGQFLADGIKYGTSFQL
jgi:hypothetical protein